MSQLLRRVWSISSETLHVCEVKTPGSHFVPGPLPQDLEIRSNYLACCLQLESLEDS